MRISIPLSAMEQLQLRSLCNEEHPTVEDVVRELVSRALEGCQRPGSWEGQWLDQVFPDAISAPWCGDALAPRAKHVIDASVWQRPEYCATPELPAGWIGRVCDGEDGILYDSPAQATREAALALAHDWINAHPGYNRAEDLLGLLEAMSEKEDATA